MSKSSDRKLECPYCHKSFLLHKFTRHKEKRCERRPGRSNRCWPPNLHVITRPNCQPGELRDILVELLRNICPILAMEIFKEGCRLAVPDGSVYAAIGATYGSSFRTQSNMSCTLFVTAIERPREDDFPTHGIKTNPIWTEYGEGSRFLP